MNQSSGAVALLFAALLSGSCAAWAADKARNLAVKTNNAVVEQRIALVIGNGAYINSPLKNPVNDARDMASKLRRLGFDVVERHNLQTRQIGGTLREFRSKLAPGAVALVFYAGHGLQIKGDNYLPAVDADINSEEDVPNQSLAMRQIMDVLDESKTRLNLVFLDACRNNPYARSFRSADRGLARISAPSGTLISYATRPGSFAADGGGRNGLYTSKLLKQMDSNLQIELVLKRVVGEVKAASQGRQEPWMEGSIEGNFCFAGCVEGEGAQVDSLAPAQARTKTNEEIEDDTWNTAQAADTAEAINAYLAGYPKGRYVAQAKVKLAASKKQAQQPAPAPVTSGGREDIETALRMEAQAAAERQKQGAWQAGTKLEIIKEEEAKFKAPEMVRIPGRNYEMGKYHVTRGEFSKFVSETNHDAGNECWTYEGGKWDVRSGRNWRNPGFTQDDTHPVTCVNWNDAQAYVAWLSKKTGRQYRLPVEAEWEYACYGGSQSEYCGGNDINTVAWYKENSNSTTHPVGQKQANGYSLYDMSGNLWQWMENKYDGINDWRALRGGSWFSMLQGVRAALRINVEPALRSNCNGFRLARTPP